MLWFWTGSKTVSSLSEQVMEEKAERIAMQIKQELQSTVGTCMRCSIGIAPNTMLGKLASDMQKPNGLTVLAESATPVGDFNKDVLQARIEAAQKELAAEQDHEKRGSIEAFIAALTHLNGAIIA